MASFEQQFEQEKAQLMASFEPQNTQLMASLEQQFEQNKAQLMASFEQHISLMTSSKQPAEHPTSSVAK